MIFNVKLGQDNVEILNDYYLELKDMEEEIKKVKQNVKVRLNKLKCKDNNIKVAYSKSKMDRNFNRIAEDSIMYNMVMDEDTLPISNFLDYESVLDIKYIQELFISYIENRKLTKSIRRDFFDDINYLMGVFSLLDIERLMLYTEGESYFSLKNKIKEKLISIIPIFMLKRFLNKKCTTKELEEYKEVMCNPELELKKYVYLLLEIILQDESILERYKESMKV